MQHSTITHNDAAQVSLVQAARADLEALANRLDGHLLPVGEALLALVQSVDTVVQGLADVSAALADGSAERAIAEVLRASEALMEAPQRQADQRPHFGLLRDKIHTLGKLSHDLDRVLLMLEFYCVNMKIAASGAGDFVEFADEMRAQLSAGRQHLADFGQTVARLIAGFDEMAAVDRVFSAECGRLIPTVPAALGEAALLLREQQASVAATVGAGEQAARRIRAEVGEALGAIQIADNVRQRIEHVNYICEQIAEAAVVEAAEQRADIEGHLAALAMAQLDAVTRDFAADAQRLLVNLEHLLPHARNLLDSIRTDASITRSAALVGQFGADIAASVQLTSQLQQANGQAALILESVLTTIEELSTRVEQVRDLGLEVGYMSVNANLRSRRDTGISKAVSVIATEIKVQSTNIDEVCCAFGMVAEEMSDVAGIVQRDGAGARLDVQNMLGQAHGALNQATARAQEGVGRIGQDCSAITTHLPDMIARVHESLLLAKELDAVCAMLSPMARQVATEVLTEVEHPLRAALDRIARVYTMQSERNIHARFTASSPGHAPEEAPEVAAPVCDDDDVLF